MTLRRGGIWNLAQTPRKFFSVSFEIFPWCLKAKFQIPPLRRRMFVINITPIMLQVPRFVSVQCTMYTVHLSLKVNWPQREENIGEIRYVFHFGANLCSHINLNDKHFSFLDALASLETTHVSQSVGQSVSESVGRNFAKVTKHPCSQPVDIQ